MSASTNFQPLCQKIYGGYVIICRGSSVLCHTFRCQHALIHWPSVRDRERLAGCLFQNPTTYLGSPANTAPLLGSQNSGSNTSTCAQIPPSQDFLLVLPDLTIRNTPQCTCHSQGYVRGCYSEVVTRHLVTPLSTAEVVASPAWARASPRLSGST